MKLVLRVTCSAAVILTAIVGPFLYNKISEIKAKSALIREDAIESYGGDEVLGIAQYVDDRSRPVHHRNHAIGMLANLSDRRALPVLEKHYTGYELSPTGTCCNLFSLCQYELKKAIERSRATEG